jgi:hypothetical protein
MGSFCQNRLVVPPEISWPVLDWVRSAKMEENHPKIAYVIRLNCQTQQRSALRGRRSPFFLA